MASFKRTLPPEVPWCLLAMTYSGILRTIKVPEYAAPRLVSVYGWTVIIRDSEMPPEAHLPWDQYQSNPRRAPEDDGA